MLTAYSRRKGRITRPEVFLLFPSSAHLPFPLLLLASSSPTRIGSVITPKTQPYQFDSANTATKPSHDYKTLISPPAPAFVIKMVHASAVEEFKKDDVELTVPPSEPRPILIIVMVRNSPQTEGLSSLSGSRILVRSSKSTPAPGSVV